MGVVNDMRVSVTDEKMLCYTANEPKRSRESHVYFTEAVFLPPQ